MLNEKGSAISIVLMIVAVISLLGVGLLTQSRLDIQLTSAIMSYDKMFSLADGASMIAYHDVKAKTRVVPYSGTDVNLDVYDKSGNVIRDVSINTVGDYTSYITLRGYSTDPTLTAGWDAGDHYSEFWTGWGVAKRNVMLGGGTTKPQSTIVVSVNKLKRGY